MTPLHRAAQKGIHISWFFLNKLKKSFWISEIGKFDLVGYIDIVKILVKNGAEVDITDNFDNTPLHLATKVMKYLNLTIQIFIYNFFQIIIKNGHGETVEFLVNEHEADITASNSIGETPLHYAVKGGKSDTIYISHKTKNPT